MSLKRTIIKVSKQNMILKGKNLSKSQKNHLTPIILTVSHNYHRQFTFCLLSFGLSKYLKSSKHSDMYTYQKQIFGWIFSLNTSAHHPKLVGRLLITYSNIKREPPPLFLLLLNYFACFKLQVHKLIQCVEIFHFII